MLETYLLRGAWAAQLVERLTPDLSSGLDRRVVSSSHTLGSTVDVEPMEMKRTEVFVD